MVYSAQKDNLARLEFIFYEEDLDEFMNAVIYN